MYVGLKQPRGDGERCVTPARAAAKETTLPPTLGLMRCRKLKMSTCQLAGNACLLSGLHDSCVS